MTRLHGEDERLFGMLLRHVGHDIKIVSVGHPDNPDTVYGCAI